MRLIHQHWQFILSLLSIVVVDLTLSGDNAVVIAAAAKSLPPEMRKRALIAGAACAVIALVTAAFFVTRLLHVKFLQVVGGIAILWIAINMFREEPPLESSAARLAGFWKAMWFIIVADVTMSTDNILAIGALAQGNFVLLLFGLGISIPLVVFASGLLASFDGPISSDRLHRRRSARPGGREYDHDRRVCCATVRAQRDVALLRRSGRRDRRAHCRMDIEGTRSALNGTGTFVEFVGDPLGAVFRSQLPFRLMPILIR